MKHTENSPAQPPIVPAHQRIEEIRKEARRILESATYSSETQFEYAKHWRRIDRWIGGAAALLAGVSGVGSLTSVLSTNWAGVIAILAAGVGAIAASIGAPQSKEKAAGSANAYRSLQQDARVFLKIDLQSLEPDKARARLQELIERLQTLNAQAEIPSERAWQRAKGQIEGGAQSFEADQP